MTTVLLRISSIVLTFRVSLKPANFEKHVTYGFRIDNDYSLIELAMEMLLMLTEKHPIAESKIPSC
jgi:hypothetical protein